MVVPVIYDRDLSLFVCTVYVISLSIHTRKLVVVIKPGWIKARMFYLLLYLKPHRMLLFSYVDIKQRQTNTGLSFQFIYLKAHRIFSFSLVPTLCGTCDMNRTTALTVCHADFIGNRVIFDIYCKRQLKTTAAVNICTKMCFIQLLFSE